MLSTISKVLEKKHLINGNLLSLCQYGFRPKNSTCNCLLDITEELDTFLRQGNYGAFSFLDLSKVFDIVNTSFY